jgi:ketosteroid isomerase-like protein
MQSQHYAAADLAALGREWIAAWNSHDLERILALYAEDAEMTSDRIQALGLEASGTLRGKDKLRMYWSKAFRLLPGLHFDLIDTYVSPDSVVVLYQNERGAQICEYCGSMRGERSGRVRPIISRISAGIVGWGKRSVPTHSR